MAKWKDIDCVYKVNAYGKIYIVLDIYPNNDMNRNINSEIDKQTAILNNEVA